MEIHLWRPGKYKSETEWQSNEHEVKDEVNKKASSQLGKESLAGIMDTGWKVNRLHTSMQSELMHITLFLATKGLH